MYSHDARLMCVRTYMVLRSLRKTALLLGASKSTIQRWIRSNPVLRKQRAARKATEYRLMSHQSALPDNLEVMWVFTAAAIEKNQGLVDWINHQKSNSSHNKYITNSSHNKTNWWIGLIIKNPY